tara:strand:- start:3083 stop:3748 length:666 start_codon:yes stop_codon:yes gene_type:complete
MYNTLRNNEYKKYVESKGTGTFNAEYISWAVMHDRLKQNFNFVKYVVHEYIIKTEKSEYTIPYMMLPDGSAVVKVTLSFETLDGDKHEHQECLAIRDFRMQASKTPDSAQVENTIRRCIAKAGSMVTGFGIELWFNEDIRDLDYRPPTLLTGETPTKGHITIEQNVKLDALRRDPVFNHTKVGARTKEWMSTNPTEEESDKAIIRLKKKIADERKLNKEKK